MSTTDAVPVAGRSDPLTGLPSRPALLTRLRTAVTGAAVGGPAFGVFAVDLDRFADVNTAYGADVADKLLVAVAARLTSWAGDDDYVARICGDEFVVVRSGVGPKQVAEAARSLLAAV